MFKVFLHSSRTNAQNASNLGICFSRGHPAQHLTLSQRNAQFCEPLRINTRLLLLQEQGASLRLWEKAKTQPLPFSVHNHWRSRPKHIVPIQIPLLADPVLHTLRKSACRRVFTFEEMSKQLLSLRRNQMYAPRAVELHNAIPQSFERTSESRQFLLHLRDSPRVVSALRQVRTK